MNKVLAAFFLGAAISFSGCTPTDSVTIEIKTNGAKHAEERYYSNQDEMRYALNESTNTIRRTDECIKVWLEEQSKESILSG